MHEHHAIVPNSDRTAILVVDGRLPVVRTEGRKQVATIAALREVYDVRVPLLRVVRLLEDSEERLTTLYEVDTPPQGWNPPKPASWAALESLRAADVEPLFADGLQEWLGEQAAELLALGAPHRPLDELRKVAPELVHLATGWPDSPFRRRSSMATCTSGMRPFKTDASSCSTGRTSHSLIRFSISRPSSSTLRQAIASG